MLIALNLNKKYYYEGTYETSWDENFGLTVTMGIYCNCFLLFDYCNFIFSWYFLKILDAKDVFAFTLFNTVFYLFREDAALSIVGSENMLVGSFNCRLFQNCCKIHIEHVHAK